MFPGLYYAAINSMKSVELCQRESDALAFNFIK